MFMGEYNHTIDPKGRLIIPSKFRDALEDGFVITKGFEGCLAIFNEDDFHHFLGKFANAADRKDVRAYQRHFLGPAQQPEFDKQGRILIPAVLRDHADLKKDVVLVGVGDRIEVWDKERWDATNSIDNIEEIAEELSEKVFMA